MELDLKNMIAGAALATTIVLFIIKFLSDRTPPLKIICREISKTSLVRIQKDALEKIHVYFYEQPVSKLGQIEFDIYNGGNEIIKSPQIRFELPAESKFLDFHIRHEPPQSPKLFDAKVSMLTSNVFDIELTYLNSRKNHGQHLIVSFVCDGDVEEVKVSGGFEDWSVHHLKPKQGRRKQLRVFRKAALVSGGIGLVVGMGTPPFLSFLDRIKIDPLLKNSYIVLAIAAIGIGGFFAIKKAYWNLIVSELNPTWYDHGQPTRHSWRRKRSGR